MDQIYSQNSLVSENKLDQGQFLISPSRNYFATLNQEGILLVYVSPHFCPANIIFSSKLAGKGVPPFYLKCNNDGNLVIYDSKEISMWTTSTWGIGKAPYRLTIQDDGNLVLYDFSGKVIWSAECKRD